jgi:hypothetical protein
MLSMLTTTMTMTIIVTIKNSVRSSGMLRCVNWSTVTDVLEDPRAFETSGTIYQLTRCRIPHGLNLQQHCRQNLKFRNIATVAVFVKWQGDEDSLWAGRSSRSIQKTANWGASKLTVFTGTKPVRISASHCIMTNVMHKLLIYLSICFCITCFGVAFSPSSEAGVQIRRWFKSTGYGVSARTPSTSSYSFHS